MKNKKRSRDLVLQLVLGGVVGFFLGILLARFLPRREAGRPVSVSASLLSVGLTLGWACLWYFASLLLHEAGHLVCGLLSGYRFVSYRAGRFICYRRGEKLHFGRYTVAGTAGQCLLAPPGEFGEEFPYVLYNLGGVLANILTACLLFAGGALAAGSTWKLLLLLAGIVCLLVGLPNLLPLKSITTDGTNLLLARRSQKARQAFWLTLAINAQLTEGTRLRDLPDAWFSDALPGPEDDPLALGIYSMSAARLADQGRLAEAAARHRALLEGCPRLIDLQKNELRCDLLLLCLLLGEEDAARALDTPELRRYCKMTAGYPARLCLSYARALLLEHDEAAARVERALFAKKAAEHPLLGETLLYGDLLDAADARAACQEA